MRFAKVANGQLLAYPYTRDDMRRDFPLTSFPLDLSAVELAEFGVVRVQATEKPTATNTRTTYTETVPELVNGVWEQRWQEVVEPVAPWRARLKCNRYQLRRALRARGFRQAAETWLANTASEESRDYFTHAPVIRRLSPAVEELRVAAGATQAQMDTLFVEAMAIQ